MCAILYSEIINFFLEIQTNFLTFISFFPLETFDTVYESLQNSQKTIEQKIDKQTDNRINKMK